MKSICRFTIETLPGQPLQITAWLESAWFEAPKLHSPRPGSDTEAAVGDLQVPEVDAQVVRRQVGLVVAVDGDGVDVVGVRVRKHPAGTRFHHEIHGPEHRHLREEGRVREDTAATSFQALVPLSAALCGGVWGGSPLTRSVVTVVGSLYLPSSSFRLYPSGLLSRSLIFHSFIVLSEARKQKRGKGQSAPFTKQQPIREPQ